jgi:hypothetical protein
MCGEGMKIQNQMEALDRMLDEAIALAIEDTSGGWDKIDKELLPMIVIYPVHNTVAKKIIFMYQRPEGSVRDLAATITAELNVKEVLPDTLPELKAYTTSGIYDEHKYARFRATIATIKHDWYQPIHVIKMKGTLNDIIKTETGSLADLANEYLTKIGETNG